MGLQTKFLIVTIGRTGSTSLQYILDEHPNAACMEEIYHDHHAANTFGAEWLELPPYVLKHRFPAMYLHMVFDGAAYIMRHPAFPSHEEFKTVHTLGAKMVGIDNPVDGHTDHPALRGMLADDKFKVIVLMRYNLVECIASGQIANLTGKWHVSAVHDEEPGFDMPSLAIDREGFLESINHAVGVIKACDEATQKSPERFHWIFYENLFNLETINSCFEHLNLSPVEEFKIKTIKQNPKQNYDMIINKDEIEAEFGKLYGRLGKKARPKFWKEIKSINQ